MIHKNAQLADAFSGRSPRHRAPGAAGKGMPAGSQLQITIQGFAVWWGRVLFGKYWKTSEKEFSWVSLSEGFQLLFVQKKKKNINILCSRKSLVNSGMKTQTKDSSESPFA